VFLVENLTNDIRNLTERLAAVNRYGWPY